MKSAVIRLLKYAFKLLHSLDPAKNGWQAIYLYGQLAGKWTTSIKYTSIEGAERFASGEWELGYSLEGRAVIDVWQIPSKKESELTGNTIESGLCVRIYDPM